MKNTTFKGISGSDNLILDIIATVRGKGNLISTFNVYFD
jgi:hypothetical protein